jgi:hypothetical protein
MRRAIRWGLSLSAVVAVSCLVGCSTLVSDVREADIVVYGGTSAGVVAAVQAARMGKSVILVSPDQHLGGLSSSGLGFTDSGNTRAVGGLAREFYERIYRYYGDPVAWRWQKISEFRNEGQSSKSRVDRDKTMWTFEPHAAEAVFEAWLKECHVTVYRGEWLHRERGVLKHDKNISSIGMLNGHVYCAKVFIDATYEGDLMAAAGVSYTVGREANAVYGERWNGVQPDAIKHHQHYFLTDVSPYRVPGVPSSGVLPGVSTEPPGKTGEGDRRVQAYCYRTCLTSNALNRVPFPKSAGYDPANYELLLREMLMGRKDFFAKFDAIPNLKTDTNNHGALSADFIGMNYAYPEASYAKRREILKAHEAYQKGLYYFVANDPRVPASIRTAMAKWGLAADEFADNGNWPYQIYVREARRMVGEHVMTEHDVLNEVPVARPIGMGSYTLDSHNCQRYITAEGFVQNEGDVGVATRGAYHIAYGSIVPKRAECRNLLVPVCVSSSHIAYGSIRMEPVFMVLGQSAATAAAQAIDEEVPVQDVDYSRLRTRLLMDRQRF